MAPRSLKNDISAGAGGNPSALATYSGAKTSNDLIDENIDERILRLIGLEDVFDLDYETYFSLLREALVKANMPGKSIPTEEFDLLKEELKRVKSKKDNGRFKVFN